MNEQSNIPALPVIAIVGATGVVGAELIASLASRNFPLSRLRLFASARSAGQTRAFRGEDILIEEISEDAFAGIDIVFFAAGASLSRKYAPLAIAAGARVIDNSSAFRTDPAIPLVVPEANGDTLDAGASLIANPNCVAAIAAVALAPLHRAWSIRRLSYVTYQSASGGGAAMMEELRAGTQAALNNGAFSPTELPHPYAFNLFSHNADIDPNTGYNGEELKVIAETRRILDLPQLPIGVTCVRVPVVRAHSLALSIRFEDHVTPDQVRTCLSDAPGLRIVDDRAANHFPMPSESTGVEDVLVGRIRTDLGDPSGRTIALFLSGDQLLKGAALNAVQIAEHLHTNAPH